jgi:hypothetical protein
VTVAVPVAPSSYVAQGNDWRGLIRPLLWDRWLLAINDNVQPGDPDPESFDRGYEYETFGEALLALILYDGEGDPLNGWTRAFPPYYRRRPGGDPAHEEVRR